MFSEALSHNVHMCVSVCVSVTQGGGGQLLRSMHSPWSFTGRQRTCGAKWKRGREDREAERESGMAGKVVEDQ